MKKFSSKRAMILMAKKYFLCSILNAKKLVDVINLDQTNFKQSNYRLLEKKKKYP